MRPLANDAEILDPDPEDRPPSDIQEGTVGHEGSPEICILGSEAGDGMTFVRVTLRLGHPTGATKSSDGYFNGHRIEARVLGPLWRVPKRGARVLVVFPGGDWETPGNGVIVGEIGSTPSSRFGRKKTVLDFGTDDVIITGRSVALIAESDEARYTVSVDPRGGAQVVADGSGLFAKDGEVVLKSVDDGGNLMSSLNLMQGEASLLETSGTTQAGVVLSSGDVSVSGGFMSFTPGNAFTVGRTASPATPALVGMTGIAGIPSTFIYFAVTP
jgi:hypothetical protein